MCNWTANLGCQSGSNRCDYPDIRNWKPLHYYPLCSEQNHKYSKRIQTLQLIDLLASTLETNTHSWGFQSSESYQCGCTHECLQRSKTYQISQGATNILIFTSVITQMLHEEWRLREVRLTISTGERPFTSVGMQMPREVWRNGELCLTISTREGLFTSVDTQMLLEVWRIRELCLTMSTKEGLFTSVGMQMWL